MNFILVTLWQAIIDHALPLSAMLIIAILIPRGGRLALRIMNRRLSEDAESTKAHLALFGALIYLVQAVLYFVLIMLALTNLGVPPTGAAIPATVVSAAIGFGAQSVIADFLSGFFMISERQFGIGDYVSFDGPSQPVEGTVVGLTLRATKIRTASGEVVIVPNGKAGVITNFSQEWSRAVVDLQVPLRAGESMDSVLEQVTTAAQLAASAHPVRNDITSELTILPALDVLAPTAAGQPWTVKIRITCDVNPARQWAVERAFRAAVLDQLWDRYETSLASTATILHAALQAPPTTSPEPSTEKSPTPSVSTQTPHSTDPHLNAVGNDVEELVDGMERRSNASDPTTSDGPGKPAHRPSTTDELEEKLQEALSVGGRVRKSTTALLIALVLIGGLALLSANPEGANAGYLNPARWIQLESSSTQ